jgi:pimeloyl-ACP methyl ester carboxylesterase
MNSLIRLFSLILIFSTACARITPSPTPSSSGSWVEEEFIFQFGDATIFSIVTLPDSPGPHPAVVIIDGAADIETRLRDGVSSTYFKDLARKLAMEGVAAVRYDPPGVGRSTGSIVFDSLEYRTDEALAVLDAMRARNDIQPDRVGFWGISQGGWVIAMAAAERPDDVAFIISVSGSGVPVVEQQIFSIEAQSRADGLAEEDISRAVLFGRTLIDWQLSEPIYQEENLAASLEIPASGALKEFVDLVYEPGEITFSESLQQGIEIMRTVKDEAWAKYLYLEELYIPQLENTTAEQLESIRSIVGETLLNDPSAYMTRVECPVLAIFGEKDVLQPSEKSAALYEKYLAEAGNQEYKFVILPGAGHSIGLFTQGYWEALSGWLTEVVLLQ